KAYSAYVMIYKDGNPEPIEYIVSETQGEGFGTLTRNYPFDPNSTYEAEVVLNYGTGIEMRSAKVNIVIPGDHHTDAPQTIASDHAGHSDTETYWDILGNKVVVLALGKGDILQGIEHNSGMTPYFVSRTATDGGNKMTRYFMVADNDYTPYGMSSPINIDLDTYWFNHHMHAKDTAGEHKTPDGKLTISFPNYRAFNELIFDGRLISEKAKLFICLYDLDDNFTQIDNDLVKEKVIIKINGQSPDPNNATELTSVVIAPDKKWQVFEFSFNSNLLVFPEISATLGVYPEPEINTITLELDQNDIGWAVEVDWAVIHYDAMSPIFLIHGASQDHTFWEGVDSQFGNIDFDDTLDDNNYTYNYEDIDISGAINGRDDVGGARVIEGGYQLAQKIPQLVKKYGSFSYNIVAHSKGGLWFRSAWEMMHDPSPPDPTAKYLNISTIVTLSTPHTGSVLADYANTMISESEYQLGLGATGYLPVTGDVPNFYEFLRTEHWNEDPDEVNMNHDYWNMSYYDLDFKNVNSFNLHNVPKIRNYVNFDDSTPEFFGLTADADNNGNNVIDTWFLGLTGEWAPLNFVYRNDVSNEIFFTNIYQIIGNEAYFNSVIVNDQIHFSDRVTESIFRPSDLYVTVDSGRGNSPAFSGSTEILTDIISHISLIVWWNGEEPSATNHATICSHETSEYLVQRHIWDLR
ncbi:MAG: hypothetical protein JXB49_17040, partial [Bacteroidales bacterium]|nr:hypothetical protein [Bacteroidales bacterium]